MAEATRAAIEIQRPAPRVTAEVQVPPKAYLNFQFSLNGTTSAKSGDDLVITLKDGAVVICRGYYSNNAEGEGPQIAVNGQALPPSALDMVLKGGEIEGLRLESGTERPNGETAGEQGEAAGQQAAGTAAGQSGQAGQASQSGQAGTSGNAANATGTSGSDAASNSASSSASSSSGSSSSGTKEGGLKLDENVDFLGGIPRLPGLDLGSDRGFDRTEIEGGPGWRGDDFATVAPAPPTQDAPPPPPIIYTEVAGLKEQGTDTAGTVTTAGKNAQDHSFTLTVPEGMTASDVTLNFSRFPGAATGELQPGTEYTTTYGKFSYTVTDTQIPVLDANGQPVLDENGVPQTRPGVEITLKYYDLDNSNATINALPEGGTLHENMSFVVTGKGAGGANSTLGSADIGFVITGSNDGPTLDKDAGNLAAHFEVKEQGVYSDNLSTTGGSWETYNPANPTDTGKFGTHKNETHVRLSAEDKDTGDSLSYSVASGSVGITGLNSAKGAELTQNSDGSYTLKIDGKACGTLTLDAATGDMVFKLNNDASVIQAMRAGERSDITLDVSVSDAGNLSDHGKVTLTIHGTNDRPTLEIKADGNISADSSGNGLAALTETGNNSTHNSVSGSLLGSDADNTQAELKFYILKDPDDVGSPSLLPTDYTSELSGKHGSLKLNPDGTFTYTENGSLVKDAVGKDTFTVIVRDKDGAFSAKEITFTVTGKHNAVEFKAGANYVLNMVEEGVYQSTTANDKYGNKDPNADNTLEGANPQYAAKTFIKGNVKEDGNGNSLIIDDDGAASKAVFKLTVKAGSSTSATITESDHMQTIVTAYGTLTFNTLTGEYAYTLGQTVDQKAAVDALTAGQKISESFTLTVSKPDFADQSRDFTVNISGMNDKPTFDVNGLALKEDTVATATGSCLNVQDPDQPSGKEHTYNIVNNSGQLFTIFGGSYGILEIDAHGNYVYKLNGALNEVQRLGEGQKGYDKFTLRVTDEKGAYTEKEVVVEITGTRDEPQFEFTRGVVYEDNQTDTQNYTGPAIATTVAGPNITVVDTVHESNRSFEVTGGTYVKSMVTSGTDQIITTEWGQLKFSTLDGSYTYTLNASANAQMQFKNKDEIFKTEGFTVKVTFKDDHGYSVTKDLHIDLKGSNDAPVIDEAASQLAAEVQRVHPAADNSPSLIAKGTIKADDIDNDAYNGTAGDTSSLVFCFEVTINGKTEYVQNINTTYGRVSINALTGEYTYELDNLNSTVLGLGPSATVGDRFTVVVRDPHGAMDKVDVNVTIKGNEFSGAGSDHYELPTVDLVVAEDSNLQNTQRPNPGVSGGETPGLNDSSGPGSGPTTGEAIRYCFKTSGGVRTQSLEGKYGSIYINAYTGEYRYVLNNEYSQVQALGALAAMMEGFDVYRYSISGNTIVDYAADGGNKYHTIKVTVKGENDDPEITGHIAAKPLNVYAGASNAETSGKITATDDDKIGADGTTATGDVLRYSFTDGQYETSATIRLTLSNGYVELNTATGEYVYHYTGGVNSGSFKETFTVYVNDNHGGQAEQEVSITITAANAQPVIISAAMSANWTGSGYSYAYAGNAAPDLKVDPDSGEILLGNTPLPKGDTLEGHMAENAAGALKGQLASWDYEVQVKPDSASYKYYICDANGKSMSNVSFTYQHGTLQMDTATGEFSFTLNKDYKEVAALNEGDELKLTYYVVVTDAGGKASPPQQMDVVIHGTNNAPLLSVAATSIVLKEDGSVNSPVLDLKIDDVDFKYNESSKPWDFNFAVETSTGYTPATGSESRIDDIFSYDTEYGVLKVDASDLTNIKYWFELKTEAAVVKNLGATDNVTLTFKVAFNDGQTLNNTSNTGEIKVTIQGQDRAPEFGSHSLTHAVGDDVFANKDTDDTLTNDLFQAGATVTISGGQLTATDADTVVSSLKYTIVGSDTGALGGKLSLNADGTYSYAFTADAAGQQMQNFKESFKVQVSDGTSSAPDMGMLNVTYDNAANEFKFQLETTGV